MVFNVELDAKSSTLVTFCFKYTYSLKKNYLQQSFMQIMQISSLPMHDTNMYEAESNSTEKMA